MNFFLTHDFLQVFFLIVHLCFLFQVFVYFFYASYTVQPRKTKVIFTTTPPYNLPILFLPLCLLSVSLTQSASPISFIPLTLPSLLQKPTVPPYTTHKLPSHLPFLCYASHTHYHLTSPSCVTQHTTTISQRLLLHLICFTNHTPTLLPLMAHTLVTPPFSFSFPLENLFSCDSYCQ